MTLFVATSNPGKLRDFATAAGSPSANPTPAILPLPGLADIPAPDETELTFLGNATLKAVFYSLHAPGWIVLADDSGLEVDDLNGSPGARSARYAQDRSPFLPPSHPALDPLLSVDQQNNLTLLHDLEQLNPHLRSARYRCSLVAARDGVLLATADGTVEGHILSTPRGSSGFGYDPLFLLPDLGLTMAEIDPATRLRLSHRGLALRNLLPLLPPAP